MVPVVRGARPYLRARMPPTGPACVVGGRAESACMPLSPPAVPDPPVVPRKARVLLVEDDASARRTLRDHLESAGWEVAEADSVRATARFDGSQVDAIIT